MNTNVPQENQPEPQGLDEIMQPPEEIGNRIEVAVIDDNLASALQQQCDIDSSDEEIFMQSRINLQRSNSLGEIEERPLGVLRRYPYQQLTSSTPSESSLRIYSGVTCVDIDNYTDFQQYSGESDSDTSSESSGPLFGVSRSIPYKKLRSSKSDDTSIFDLEEIESDTSTAMTTLQDETKSYESFENSLSEENILYSYSSSEEYLYSDQLDSYISTNEKEEEICTELLNDDECQIDSDSSIDEDQEKNSSGITAEPSIWSINFQFLETHNDTNNSGNAALRNQMDLSGIAGRAPLTPPIPELPNINYREVLNDHVVSSTEAEHF